VVEIGVPFSDPMADGSTIQRASFAALEQGVTLPWILQEIAALARPRRAPLLLMSYLNPLLAFGLDRLPKAALEAGVSGFIVPDLPYEESGELKSALDREGLALVQMVTPVTPEPRLKMLCGAAQGFIYAVTMTGTTGKSAEIPDAVLDYMDRVKRCSSIPVCAGFGIRSRAQVTRFARHVDGVVIGSALVETLERGEDARAFLESLR
jgi:tryptophan synthase alpha chain